MEGLVPVDQNRFQIQHCAGTVDKNGKPIFQGDIVLAYMVQGPYSANRKTKPCYFEVIRAHNFEYGWTITINHLTHIPRGDVTIERTQTVATSRLSATSSRLRSSFSSVTSTNRSLK